MLRRVLMLPAFVSASRQAGATVGQAYAGGFSRLAPLALAAALGLGGVALASPMLAHCHCQVPCGIFGDHGRIQECQEHVGTIRKAARQVRELHASAGTNVQSFHQMARWISVKEEHADKIMQTASSYFMAQRVKSANMSRGDYLALLEKLHILMQAAMATKQTTDDAMVQKLDDALQAVAAHYPPPSHSH